MPPRIVLEPSLLDTVIRMKLRDLRDHLSIVRKLEHENDLPPDMAELLLLHNVLQAKTADRYVVGHVSTALELAELGDGMGRFDLLVEKGLLPAELGRELTEAVEDLDRAATARVSGQSVDLGRLAAHAETFGRLLALFGVDPDGGGSTPAPPPADEPADEDDRPTPRILPPRTSRPR